MKQAMPRFDPFWTVAGKIFLWLLFHTYLPTRVRGRFNIPRRGPVILIANHISYLDPMLIGWASLPRLVYYMGKKELFDSRFVSFILSRWGTFPVDRSSLDRQAIVISLALLKDGQVLGLFPEGTRSGSGEMQQMRSGAVRFAVKMRCPILPVGVKGTDRSFGRGAKLPKPARLSVRFGQPFELTEFYDQPMTAERTEQAVNLMHEKIAALLSLTISPCGRGRVRGDAEAHQCSS